MEDTVFTKIIRRELPAEILYEDDKVIVILDRFPTVEGQTLVITKEQTPYVFALEADAYTHLMATAQKIARVLDDAFATSRTCMVIEGFDVPHVHVRLYPLTNQSLSLEHGEMASDEALAEVGNKIRTHFPA